MPLVALSREGSKQGRARLGGVKGIMGEQNKEQGWHRSLVQTVVAALFV